MASQHAPIRTCYELRFESLTNAGRGFTFPCDASGRVDMDALTERGRNSYLGARALVGRDFAYPVVKVAAH